MLTFILLGLVTVGCIVWVITSDWDLQENAIAFAIVMGFPLAITALTLCNREKRFENTIERYKNLKMQVEDYNALPDSAKITSLEYDIREDVLYMNNIISKHKVMHESIWTGPWYSEEVGNLPKLHIIGKNENELLQTTEISNKQNQ